jgi:hypothetical protein
MRRGVLVMAVAALLAGCSREPASVKVDPALAALVPADAVMVAGVRMEAVRSTPFYQKWVGRRQVVDLDKFASETGIDPRQDIGELLFASDGKIGIVFAKGRFPESTLRRMLERSGARKIQHGKYTLYGTEEAAVVLLNETTVAAGPAPALRAVLERRSGGLSTQFREKLKTIAPDTQIWIASLGFSPLAEKLPEAGNLANLRRILATVENTTLALDLRYGVNLTAAGSCKTEQDAKFIHDGIRGLLGMGRLSTPDNEPDLLRFYDAFQVSRQKSVLSVKAEIPMDVLEKFLTRMERMRPG